MKNSGRRIHPGKIRALSRVLSGGGPALPEAKASATVDTLRTQARRAPELVAQITELEDAAKVAAQAEVLVVDRATWAGGAAASIAAMLPPEDSPVGTPELGLALVAFAPRILGQYDPYSAPDSPGRLYLVAPNIADFRAAYDLDQRDLARWVAVHELTHAVQFAAAPWLREAVVERVAKILRLGEGDEPDTPESDAAGEQLFSEVKAIMTLLEGHAEYVMNNVPRQRMPGRDRIVEAMTDRRTPKNPLIAFLSKKLGVAEKLAQYTGGEKFVAAVVDAAGMDGFNRVFEREENLPTSHELESPAAWVARVIGQDA
ncbi:zinc-dependent metalloprotease [Trueperella bialowiezensis]|uniref:Uncharacterized conserved protein n=1 Tax=Trueperella bialowiezensis TaxID=312285 RepID=A0A3S5EW43_9ACTO|nr:zinc-dependent metalloprotease [Trueperella bialowiezensis]VEI13650.1 Uncharacterized conserved protein [Trueperella bialowiezensis]